MKRIFRLAAAICALLGVLLLLVSFTPLVSWLSRDMAVDWYDGDADVLVVLGATMLVNGPSPRAALGYESYLRCAYASWFVRQRQYRYVILSGAYGMGDTMAEYLAARGVPREKLLVENAAKSTFENAAFVKTIIEHQRDLPAHPTIAVLTSDYHTHRARAVFEHQGMRVRMIPVPDVAKRASFARQRWDVFLTLAEEYTKDVFYKLNGKI